MTSIETLAAYVSRGVRGKASGATKEKISLHLADTVTAWTAGARSAEGRALAAFLAPGGKPAPLSEQLVLHCAVTRLSEIDDIHLASCTTPGAMVVPAALTLAAALRAPGAAIAESILAGYETMVRLGAAFDGPSILYRGIWPTYFIAPAGVAAVAARLLELDPAQSAHALSLALISSTPGVGHPAGPRMARWLAIGQAAARGLAAAQAAKEGFTGDTGLLDRDFMASVYAISPKVAELSEALGERHALEAVSHKPWCAARQTMAASQAARDFVREGIAVEGISAVTVQVPPPYLRMVAHGVIPGDRASFLTSAPYQVALALLDPAAQYLLSPGDAAMPAAVKSMLEKVKVEADAALLSHYPRAWPARLTLVDAAGRHEKLSIDVPGDPGRALGEAGVREKSARVLGPLAGAAAAAELFDASIAVIEGEARAAPLLEKIARVSAA